MGGKAGGGVGGLMGGWVEGRVHWLISSERTSGDLSDGPVLSPYPNINI